MNLVGTPGRPVGSKKPASSPSIHAQSIASARRTNSWRMLMIWSSRERNRSFAPLLSVFFGRIDALLDAATESRIEVQAESPKPNQNRKISTANRGVSCKIEVFSAGKIDSRSAAWPLFTDDYKGGDR